MDPTSLNVAKTQDDYRIFVSEFGYLAAFSNAGGSNLSDVENYVKFCTF